MNACEYIYAQQQSAIALAFIEERSLCLATWPHDGRECFECQLVAHIHMSDKNAQAEIGLFECLIFGCPGDFNQDGKRDVDDLLVVINNWSVVGTDGLLEVIQNWGACE